MVYWSQIRVDLYNQIGANNDDQISYLVNVLGELGKIVTRYDFLESDFEQCSNQLFHFW